MLNESSTIVVIGAGQAGVQLTASLRDSGFPGRVVLIGDEPELPYQRPPLSKSFLLGQVEAETLRLRPSQFFEERHIDFLNAERAIAIDRGHRSVILQTGDEVRYDHLVLATGARNRTLKVAGAELDGVVQLRTLDDAKNIRARLSDVRRAVVIGAGFIGLEFAAVASTLAIEAHILELAERPLARTLSRPMGERLEREHRGWNNHLHVRTGVTRIVGERGRVTAVVTDQGESLPADLVLVGIGVEPNDALARAAGLAVDDGVLVSNHLHTHDPAISAIGDCARYLSDTHGSSLRLESVQNAVEQARSLASTLCGRPTAYTSVPWFWSDQRELKLQMAGLSTGHEQTVVLGDSSAKTFSVLCFRKRRLIAVESLNQALEHMLARRLLGRTCTLTPEEAAAHDFSLKAFELSTRTART